MCFVVTRSTETASSLCKIVQRKRMVRQMGEKMEIKIPLEKMDHQKSRYPFCIVWTPIPVLTWMFPFVGHMGIATSTGVIRDFAGPYYVSEDDMAFGKPTRYLPMDPSRALNGVSGWDYAVSEASTTYGDRMHNLCCDNCHSHVASALDSMQYNGSSSWNMIKLSMMMFTHGRYVGLTGTLKTWLPFLLLVALIITLCFVIPRQ